MYTPSPSSPASDNLQPQSIILHIHTPRQNRTLVIGRVGGQTEHDLVLALDEELRVEFEFVRDVVAADCGADSAG
jgi:hypothetical protein